MLVISIIIFLIVWQIVSIFTPLFIPNIRDTLMGAYEILADGTLVNYSGLTLARVLIGWVIGCAIAIPLGWIIGNSKIVESLVDPYINFFRFIPPIVWVTLAVLWIGYGEASRILLVAYTTLFGVTIHAIVGIHQIEEEKIRAARSLGADGIKLFYHVKVPSSLPQVYTGMRVALGGSFMTIVAVEMLTASSGIGYIIWVSRLYFRMDWVLVGIALLGVLGFLMDFLFKKIGQISPIKKYGIKV